MEPIGCTGAELERDLPFTMIKTASHSMITKKAREPKRAGLNLSRNDRDQAAISSSSVITGPESWPLADTSRSTNSMIEICAASLMRMPHLMIRQ